MEAIHKLSLFSTLMGFMIKSTRNIKKMMKVKGIHSK